MISEALAQVRAEAVVDRTAVGVVGVHVAEGHTAGKCCGIAGGVEAGSAYARCLHKLQDCWSKGGDTSSSAISGQKIGDRGIDAAGPEKAHERSLDPRLARMRVDTAGSISGSRGTDAHAQRTARAGIRSWIAESRIVIG